MRKTEEPRVLLVYNNLSSFVQVDYDVLSRQFEVIPLHLGKLQDLPYALRAALRTEVGFAWFGDFHAAVMTLLSRILRKKALVIVGGYDAASLPELGYGLFSTARGSLIAGVSYRLADRILVVDDTLRDDIIRYTGMSGDKITYLPTGFDHDKWRPAGEKENLVLTVAKIDAIRIKLKGLDTFVRAAERVSEATFVLIGDYDRSSERYLRDIGPENLVFTGYLSRTELLSWYQRAGVYCQLSLREGLPSALCEAMLCGCIPVGTRVNGIPKAIGDTGYYVSYGDEEGTARAIRAALKAGSAQSLAVRERIATEFPLSRREEGLASATWEVLAR